MTDQEEESKRISLQVTSISTQLIESVEKQSHLEEQLSHSKREISSLREQISDLANLRKEHENLKVDYEKILKHNNGLGQKLEVERREKDNATEEVSKLRKEVEELSESLFSEANKMVSDARKETHEIKLRNENLIVQLKEKDLLLGDLQSQLKELKNNILHRDSESTYRNDSTDDLPSQHHTNSHLHVLYSPTVNSIRFDLKLFAEFRKFLKSLDQIESIRSTDTKFLKRLLTDDVEPALRFDLASGISWLSKRPLMSAIIDGRVAIEPVSGINETYRLNFQNNKTSDSDVKSNLYSYPPDSPPVAVNQPCSVCGESRSDILEHSRLYVMKVHPKKDDTSLSSQTSAAVIASQYPLCSYCLFRVRSCCDLFAFLRSLKTDSWKLDNETVIKKAWIELSRLRGKLFWAKVGIWDIDTNIVTTKVTPSITDNISKDLTQNQSRISYMSSTESLEEASTPIPGSLSLSSKYKESPLSNVLNQNTNEIKSNEQDHSQTPDTEYDNGLLDSYSKSESEVPSESESLSDNGNVEQKYSSLDPVSNDSSNEEFGTPEQEKEFELQDNL